MSLLWPPFEPGGYSLISDGVVRDLGDERVAFAPHTCRAAPPRRRAGRKGRQRLHGGLRAAHLRLLKQA